MRADIEAHFRLAEAQLALGAVDSASRHAEEAVRLGAGGPAARELWAASLAACGELHAAIVVLRAGDAAIRPAHDYLRVIGKRLARAGLNARALECFRLLLQHHPADAEVIHLAAALAGDNPPHPAPGYVRQYFDAFAPTFEQQLNALNYAAPRAIKDGVVAVASRPPPWQVLDLGSGTGLVASALAGLTRHVDGIDVSPEMVERSRQTGLYRSVTQSELVPAMAAAMAGTFDVVTAADVFIYVGKIDAVIAAARRVLRSGGMLAFTAEAAEFARDTHAEPDPGFWLQYTGRYAQSQAYLDRLAGQHGFRVARRERISIRLEAGTSVQGWSEVWIATGFAPESAEVNRVD